VMLRQGKIEKVNKPEILIISDTLDYTTDYITVELSERKQNYLRINRDKFAECSMTFDIDSVTLLIEQSNMRFSLSEPNLKAIYFRAPIYLRDIYQPDISEETQLYRTQWAAFIRNLAIFENPLWINNPIATFKAENKLLQLKYAKNAGFQLPRTLVTNRCLENIKSDSDYIIKSIDTAVLRIEDKEAFVYSNVVKGNELELAELSIAPVIIQDYLRPKTDIRVTVIGDSIFPVKILLNGSGVEGDWRRIKEGVQFIECTLPEEVSQACVNLVHSLGLTFGAVDLIESDDRIYFLEINPTGEWGWLVHAAGIPLHETLCNLLELGNV
jgi:glutathione synthase/RimK-type ligase-like ATP-grasp enzyme